MPKVRRPSTSATEADRSALRAPLPGSKLAAVIAAEIESDIMARKWPIGEVIGSERDLLERYGVSRAVLREAVRLLEQHQSASMRRGPGGGLVVTRPDATAVAASAVMYLDSRGVTPAQLQEIRRALELAAVELATTKLTEAGIEVLRNGLAAESKALQDDGGPYINDQLHHNIAELTGNPVFSLFISVLSTLSIERGRIADSLGVRERESHLPHTLIVDAMVRGDSDRARQRMDAHLSAITEFLTEREEHPKTKKRVRASDAPDVKS